MILGRSRLILMVVAGLVATSAAARAEAATQSDRAKFIDTCTERLFKHDQSVIKDCYTSNFVLISGPETYAAPNRQLVGENAVRGMMIMGRGDASAFEAITQSWEDIAETEDTVVRRLRYVMKHPRASNYAGFTNLPRDLIVTCDILVVYKFREGKIATQIAQYDSLGFFLDLARGDPQQVAAALTAMKPLMDAMKSGVVPEMPSSPAPAN